MKFQALIIVTLISLFSTTVLAQTQNRTDALKELEALRTQIKKLEAIIIEPSVEDKNAFSGFLENPDTGLIRLLPREKYDGKLTVSGGGAYYSFALKTHEYGRGSDISFEQGDLSVGFAGADYGMLAKLGKVALDEVTLENSFVQVVAQHKPPTTEPEARIEQRRAGEEFVKDGVLYRQSLVALIDNVYILRSVSYGDSDVLVVFKIIREDADGSLILVWKLLKKYSIPRLER